MAGGDDLGLAELGTATLGAAGAVLTSRHHDQSRDICRFGAALEPSPTAPSAPLVGTVWQLFGRGDCDFLG